MEHTLAERIDSQDIDHVWTIRDGEVVDDFPNLFAPTVTLNEDHEVRDGAEELEIDGSGWEGVIPGFTGQHGYRGHVMHTSEFIGGYIAQHIAELAAGGDYDAFAIVAVEVYPEDETIEGFEDTPAGWTIVGHRVG